MNSPPEAAYTYVRDTDPATLDAAELDAYLRRISELRAWCDARQVRATRRQRQLANEGRSADPRHSLTNHGRQSSRDAAAAAERERVCTSMPGFENALAGGAISAGHVDAVANATKHLDDAESAEFASVAGDVLADATRQGVDAFAKNCRDLARGIRARSNADSDVDELERQRAQSKVSRWIDRDTGMHKTLIECGPISDRQLWAAVQAERGRLRRRNQSAGGTKASWDRLTVDAFISAVTTETPGVGRPSLTVLVDLQTFTTGRHGQTLCETDSGVAVPVETMRHLACEADIIPVVLDGNGVVLDQGRAKRLATAEQRTALQAMHTTCVHPECTVSIDDCRIHHLTPWSRGGRSDLANLAPVCETHHHLVHEGGWTLTIDADRTATWAMPNGEIYSCARSTDRRPVATC